MLPEATGVRKSDLISLDVVCVACATGKDTGQDGNSSGQGCILSDHRR